LSDKNDKGEPFEKAHFDSIELFDDILRDEPTDDPSDTAEKKANVAGKSSKEKAKPSVVNRGNVMKGKRIGKRSDTEREADRQRKVEIPLQAKLKKRSNPLVLILAIVVLLTLTGFIINYYGIVDFKNLIGSSIDFLKQVKEDKIRMRIAKKGQDKRVAKKLSTPSMVIETGKGKPKIHYSLKTPQSKETTPRVKQKPSVPVHAGYPYSLYLGSYRTRKSVHGMVSKSRKIGLSPYWVKVDLGDKGTWFRIFAGYFKTKKSADTFIKVRRIGGAESRHTKYANLIGTYTSAGKLDKKQTALMELAYCPYVINHKKDVLHLYVGAFSQKHRAEKQNAALASKGIRSILVKR
jgi:cell division septation protein DedD